MILSTWNIVLTRHSLWGIEYCSVIIGIIAAFVAQYALGIMPCLLCWVARDVWIVYALVLPMAWRSDSREVLVNFWNRCLRVLRIILIIIAVIHVAVIYGLSDVCMSTDLMRLRGGIWSYIADLDIRGCADEPNLWGWLNMPLCMLVIYCLWEFLDLMRRKMRHIRRDNV